MNKNKLSAILVVIVAIAVIGAIFYSAMDVGNMLTKDFNGNFAFDVEIQDPSFHIVNVNGTYLAQADVSNYSYNSTQLTIHLPANWRGFSSNYMYELVNTLNTSISINIANNFTNGALFTYMVLKNGQLAGQYGTIHNATFEVLLQNNNTGNYTTKMVVAHNLMSDGNFTYSQVNETVITTAIVGDGSPIVNGTLNITIPSHYYVEIGLGNMHWINKFMPSVSPAIVHSGGNVTHGNVNNTYYAGTLTV